MNDVAAERLHYSKKKTFPLNDNNVKAWRLIVENQTTTGHNFFLFLIFPREKKKNDMLINVI